MDEHYRVWRRFAPLGLLLVGLGTCLAADAATRKSQGQELSVWVGEGTAGLVALNAGLSVFGEAVKRRALFEAGSAGS